MANLKRKCIVLICIAYLVGMGLYLPLYSVSAYPTYPQTGIIAMWTGSTIPTGWQLVSTVNDRFVMGTSTGETPGGTGGSAYHDHAYTQIPYHGHGYTSSASITHSHSYTGGGSTANKGTSGSDIRTLYTGSQSSIGGSISDHVHSVYATGSSTCYTQVTNPLPPYQTVTYIKKVSPTAVYPAGLIVISTSGSIPSGWLRCDGANGTPDLRGDFLMGSVSPGVTGGNTAHNHVYSQVPYHSHTMERDGGSHTHNAYQSTTMVSEDTWITFAYDVVVATLQQSSTYHFNHGHTVPYVGSSTCYTASMSHLPLYTAVDFLMNTQDITALPVGVIALWDGVAATIPYGWKVSDGASGTVDLRNKFVRGRFSEAPGSTGGSSSHSHTYSTIPYHTHSVLSGDAYHAHQMYGYGGLALGEETLFDLGAPVYVSSGSRTTTPTTYTHSHYINFAGSTGSLSTQSASNNPPYVKLTYIQCGDYDGNIPLFTSTPPDRFLEYGYSGESISWTATDLNPDVYSINLLGSGTVYGPATWSSGIPIPYNIPNGFGVGSYTYEIDIFDKYGNPNTDSVTLTVQDTTSPMLTQIPSPLTVELGYTGQSYSWTATDYNPDYYDIELLGTGTVVDPTGWTSGSPIVYNIPDGFDVGIYTYTITFVDDYGNSDWDTVTFTVEDTTGPAIVSAPSDVVIELGDAGPLLSWTVTDPHSGTYDLDMDGTPYVTDITWTSGIPIEFDTAPLSLGVGVYTFTLSVSDIYGNFNTDSVNITVEDTIAPALGTPPSDIVSEYGSTGLNIEWAFSDLAPGEYSVELAGTGIVYGPIAWSSGIPIVYNIPDGYGLGTYSFTINVSDASGNFMTDTVTLTVEDTTVPEILSYPDDMTIEVGYSGQSISWVTTDFLPVTYTIEKMGTGIVVDHTIWISGDIVTYALPENLGVGDHTYIITFYDEGGNTVTDTVVITIEYKPTPPVPKIPGFSVPFILLISVCTVVGSILTIKKKHFS